MSKGEDKISSYLKKNKISFVEQKTFKGCKHKRVLPFDFYLPKHKILIEYQGAQHYKAVELFGGKEALKGQKHRDKIKRNYAKKRKIKLIIISYRKFNRIQSILRRRIK